MALKHALKHALLGCRLYIILLFAAIKLKYLWPVNFCEFKTAGSCLYNFLRKYFKSVSQLLRKTCYGLLMWRTTRLDI